METTICKPDAVEQAADFSGVEQTVESLHGEIEIRCRRDLRSFVTGMTSWELADISVSRFQPPLYFEVSWDGGWKPPLRQKGQAALFSPAFKSTESKTETAFDVLTVWRNSAACHRSTSRAWK